MSIISTIVTSTFYKNILANYLNTNFIHFVNNAQNPFKRINIYGSA